MNIFLVFVLLITMMVPSSAATYTGDMDVFVTESNGQITLQWQDPESSLYARMKISGAGKVIYVDAGVQQAVFSDLINGIQYSFRVSAISNTGVILNETVVWGTPRDVTPPAAVSGANGIPGEGCVFLNWIDPFDEDLDRIRIAGINGIVEVDKGVGQFVAEELDNGTEYRFVITAVDTSDNESEGVEVVSIPEAGARIHLDGPGTVPSGQPFSVFMDLNSSRSDIYAVEASLQYNADYFEYLAYEQAENGIMVVGLDDSSEGTIEVFVASDGSPITGQGNRLITLRFQAKNTQENHTGWFQLGQAFAGLAPSGDKIPAVANSIGITVTQESGDQTHPAEVTGVTVKAGDGFLKLNWIDPEDADLKSIVITLNDSNTYEVGKGVQEAVINGLVNGQLVTVKIQTVDETGNASVGIHITGIPGVEGDLNFDGVIDVGDLALAAYYYRSQEGQPGWEQARYCDITGNSGQPDGIVDILDIVFVAAKILEQP